MWWLQDVSQPNKRPTRVLHSQVDPSLRKTRLTEEVQRNAPRPQRCRPQRRQPPLLDLLTSSQHDANRILMEIDGEADGHSDSLRADLRSLEVSLRTHRSSFLSEHAKRQLCERLLRDATEENQELQQTNRCVYQQLQKKESEVHSLQRELDVAVIENESIRHGIRHQRRSHAELKEQLLRIPTLQEQVQEAKRLANQWQKFASSNSSAKHAAVEQADRIKSLLDEKSSELDSHKADSSKQLAEVSQGMKRAESMTTVWQLRTERLRSQQQSQRSHVRQSRRELARIQRAKAQLESQSTVALDQQSKTVCALETLLVQRARDLDHTRQETFAYATRLAQNNETITKLHQSNAALVQLQSDQYDDLRKNIEGLVAKLEGQRQETHWLHFALAENQQQSGRMIALLSRQRDAFFKLHQNSQQSALQADSQLQERRDLEQKRLHETSMMRAQLSAGRAKGQALLAKHDEKIDKYRHHLTVMEQHRNELIKQVETLDFIAKQRSAEINQLMQRIGRHAA